MTSSLCAQLVRGLWLALVITVVAQADVKHLITGEVIPGTEGIEPGPGAPLNQLDLSYARLYYLDLTEADFSQSNLAQADLHGSLLMNASFSNANLDRANLSGATLNGADFYRADVTGLRLHGATTRGFTQEQLYTTASYEAKNLAEIGISNSDLTNWDFRGQVLSNADFGSSALSGADFTDAVIAGTNLYDVTSRGFTKEQLYSTASYRAKDLRGMRCPLNDFSGWNLSGQDFTGAAFATSNRGQNYGLNLTDADLSGAMLADVRIGDESILTNANVTGADLRGASPYDVDRFTSRTANLIRQNGEVWGLSLFAGQKLLVRDYDGSPSRAPIAITVNDLFEISDGGELQLQFEADAWDSHIRFEPGIPVQLSGTLDLQFANNIEVTTQIGRTFHIFDWSGVSPDGEFTVSSPYRWDTTRLYSTGDVTLTAVPEPSTWRLFGMATASILGWWKARYRLGNRRITI